MRFIVDECKNILNNSANLSKHFELITSHPTLAKFFMEQVGLKVDRVDLDGNSLLSSIVIYNETSKAVFDYLIAKGADVNLKNQSLKTPLMIAYSDSNGKLAKFQKIQLLLQYGASITDKMNGTSLIEIDPEFSEKFTAKFHADFADDRMQTLTEFNFVDLRRQ